MKIRNALIVFLLSLLGACSLQSASPQPFQPQATRGANGRPAIIAPGSPQPRPIMYCPPIFVAQGQRIMAQLARVRLGSDKLTVQSLLGSPIRAESFLLTDGGTAEVMYYPTPQSACGRADAMLPMVFQNNRLIGYGPDYYQNFVVPTLKTPLSIPAAAAPSYIAPQQTSQPPSQGGYPARMMQEDLPQGPASAPYRDYIPPANEPTPNYTLSPEFQQQWQLENQQPAPQPQPYQNLGRGTPLTN